MTDLIPKEDLERARRRLKRHIVSVIVDAMADEDIGPDEIATSLGVQTWEIHAWIRSMLDGTANDFDAVSDIAVALDREVVILLAKRIEQPFVD